MIVQPGPATGFAVSDTVDSYDGEHDIKLGPFWSKNVDRILHHHHFFKVDSYIRGRFRDF